MGLNLNWFKSYDTNEKHAKMEKKKSPKTIHGFLFLQNRTKTKMEIFAFFEPIKI